LSGVHHAMIYLTDYELVCALLQLCLRLRHAVEAERRRGLARRLAHRQTN
jgi:hypothetical protein